MAEPATPGNGAASPRVVDRLQQLFVRAVGPKAPPSRSDDGPIGDGGGRTEGVTRDGGGRTRAVDDDDVRVAVTQIDPTERKIGLIGALVAAVLSLVILVPRIEHPTRPYSTATPGKHHSCTSGYVYTTYHGHLTCAAYATRNSSIFDLVLALVFVVVILAAVQVGRRSFVAFSLLMAGFALEYALKSILAVLFVFAGGWLVMRAWRVQRYGSPNASAAVRRAAETERRAAKKAPSAATSRTPAGGRRKAKTAEVVTASGRPKPGANKRYTPKAPPRRKPPPPEG